MTSYVAEIIDTGRRALRRVLKPKPVRLPGTYPWTVLPAPLPRGTILINNNPPVVADGAGGVMVGVQRLPQRATKRRRGAP